MQDILLSWQLKMPKSNCVINFWRGFEKSFEIQTALYNIVDQIFIANASYLGSYGNAANTVVFPLTVIALGIAVMIGDGCCAFVSISLGEKKTENATRSVGNSSVLLCIISSIVLISIYLIFAEPILTAFGGRVNAETFELSKKYFFWIALGIPFYMFGQAMNPIIRADGSPKFAMISTVAGAVINIILDPIFIFVLGNCETREARSQSWSKTRKNSRRARILEWKVDNRTF